MKKASILLLIVFGLFNKNFAQWNNVNIGTTQDLYSVDYFSSNDIWIGSFNQIIKTTNGGSNWNIVNPINDPTNIQILPANMNDLALTSANTAIGAGLFFMGNNECILTTNNAGVNWTIATNNSTVPLLRYINTVDVFSNRAVAAGNSGRLAISSNSGGSWTFVNSGTVKMINDVKFISIDTVIAAGEGVILKSLNSGSTWSTITTYTTSFKSVSCKNNVVYIGSEYDNTILKSTDYGVTYTSMPLPFISKGIICAISKDTLLCSASDGLYVSKTGGQYWEKYSLAGYRPIKMIDFLTPNVLTAVGDQGYVIKTNNLSLAPTLPICTFSIQGNTNLCLNDSITLINHSAPLPGYTYQWKHNNVTFSNQYNSGIRLNTAGTHTISLSVSNAYGTTTQTTQVYVTGHELNPFTMISSVDTLCSFTNVGLAVTNSDPNVKYLFRRGFTNLLPFSFGNGGLLQFQTPYSTYSLSPYNIKATLTNVCYTDSIVQSSNFVVSTSNFTYMSTPSQGYCASSGITNVTLNTLNHTTNTLFNNYFNYSCCKGTTVSVGSTYTISVSTINPAGEYVYAWIDYNNDGLYTNATELVFSGFANSTATGTITIPNTLLMNQKFRFRVASDDQANVPNGNYSFGCGQIEDYYIIIKPGAFIPTASFNKSATTLDGCVSNVSFTNTAYNAETILWNFGDGTSSTLAVTSHTFNPFVGSYTVSLIACNLYGCDTTEQVITLTVAPTPSAAACTPVNTNNCFGNPRPVITKFQKIDLQGIENLIYNDNTCSKQFYLEKDSAYYFVIGCSNNGYLTVYADLNNDGVFTPQVESITAAVGYLGVSAGTSGLITLKVPNFGIDSIPVRIRAMVNTTIPFDNCNLTCGDYKDFTLYTSPHQLQTIFSTATNTVCGADSVNVYFQNQSKGASTYLWNFGDGTTSTIKEPTHTYTNTGVYNVKLVIYNGTKKDSLIKTNYITVNLGFPTPTLTINGTVLSTTSTASSYQWYKNGSLISGATSPSLTLTQDGNYVLNLINTNGCNSSSANYAYFPTHINFTLNPDTVCTGEYTVLYRSGANGTNFNLTWGDGTGLYNWNGTTGPMHTYSVAGTYTVKLKGCGPYNCDSLSKTIVVKPGQDTAVIVLNAGVFSTTTTATYYQWYESNFPIAGATAATYTPTQDGYYNVKLENTSGCSSLSGYNVYFPIRPIFVADTTGYCGVLNADVQFSNTSSNALNYLWDFGDGTSSSIQSPNHNYNAPGTYTVKLKACSATTCDSLIKTNYITVSALPFSPVVTPSVIPAFCDGTAINFTLSCTSGAGYLYQWQGSGQNIVGETTSNYVVSYEDTYGAIVTNSLGCVAATNTVSIIADYECVWPGDADFSYNVDNYDLLPVGLYYNQTGAARTFTSNAWQANPASNWGTTQGLWGPDLKHIDSNGDGIINSDDTLAINLNYTFTHNKNSNNVSHASTQSIYNVSLSSSNSNYVAGNWVDIDVNVGDASLPVANFYGIAFSFWYDAALAEPGTMKITYPTSWVNAGGANTISMTKTDEPSYEVYGALSKINQLNANGYGQLAKLHFQVNTQLTQQTTMDFSINDVSMIDSSGTYKTLNYGPDLSITVDPLTINVSELNNESNVAIYPNPYYDKTQISYKVQNKDHVQIDVLNALGQKLKTLHTGVQQPGNYKLDFSAKENGLDAGVYFIKLNIGDAIITKKIIELK
ncbi:MAG: PKD domain-containing protein [Bacteroidia bacterium]|nr:PKD domain-containing protein [Bacteroidia bacterium]